MIPLVYFLIAWLVLVGLFGIGALLTLGMNLRYSVATAGAYISTGLFVVVSASALIACGLYIATVDWTQTVELFAPISIGFAP